MNSTEMILKREMVHLREEGHILALDGSMHKRICALMVLLKCAGRSIFKSNHVGYVQAA